MKQDRIVAIIQARMASTRLPGKVLKRINDKSILEILINRVKRSKKISSLVVATTEKKKDDKIIGLAKKLGVEWYRGSEDDVLKRYIDASKIAKATVIVRITADNPLTDPELMDKLIESHLKGEADYTHCVGAPLGISVEVVNRDILEKVDSIAKNAEYREHVTFYILDHPQSFKIHTVKAEELGLDYPELRLTVDTEEDLELIRKLTENFGNLEVLEIRELIRFLIKHPSIANINVQIKQRRPRISKKVSIIIRTYNSGRFVTNAVESALKQETPSGLYEILVVDDGSTDNTRETLKSYGNKIRVIEQQRRGYVNAMNCGISNTEGEYIILLDADDTFEPEIISEMLSVFENERELGFVYCDYYEKNMETDETKVISLKENIFNSVAEGIMFRKEVVEEVGMYDESLVFAEYDLLIKVVKKYQGKHIPRPLFTYHRHKGSITADQEKVRVGKEQLFARYGVIEGLRDY